MGFIVEGAKLVLGDRRYWKHVTVPWLWSTLIFVFAIVVGYFLFVPWIQGHVSGSYSGFFRFLVSVAYFVIWFFAAGFVFLTITSLTSSFLWEGLSQKIEEHVTGVAAPRCTLPRGRLFSDAFSRFAFSCAAAVLSLFCGWVVPFVLPILLAGWICLLDYTSPAFLRYNRTIGEQWPVVTKMKGWLSFQIVAGLLTLLPFVNVLLLPVLVAGGTIMAVRSKVLSD